MSKECDLRYIVSQSPTGASDITHSILVLCEAAICNHPIPNVGPSNSTGNNSRDGHGDDDRRQERTPLDQFEKRQKNGG